ncbi:hypothetical protein GCM10011391_28430 [Pullulanibacillus camelliae]|uniref:Uncharacterized protein n=1 Tax=Pullulanibacillus camelliae TaxID=1707096 RepID=A0A8J2YKG1_9BACL|nr:hypothetical protein [Pullulanibacillus camelliae]GGE47962.1 hypothetical protein GCM10011391_28430 [Pullulanibacillus camelliae]
MGKFVWFVTPVLKASEVRDNARAYMATEDKRKAITSGKVTA